MVQRLLVFDVVYARKLLPEQKMFAPNFCQKKREKLVSHEVDMKSFSNLKRFFKIRFKICLSY